MSSFSIIADLEATLYASKVCSNAQGLALIKAASDVNEWGVNLFECACLCKGGCVISTTLLENIQAT
eukprot:14784801-Ditylum_brightwellii.AAC.1